jgi:hypothetical protein
MLVSKEFENIIGIILDHLHIVILHTINYKVQHTINYKVQHTSLITMFQGLMSQMRATGLGKREC